MTGESESERERCPVHNLALNAQGECILCRRAEAEGGMPAATKMVLGILLVGCLAALGWYTFAGDGATPHGGSAPGAASDVFMVGSVEVSKDDFIGTWITKSCSGTIYTTFHADGSYSVRMVRRDGREARKPDGTWWLSDGKLIWVHGFDTSRTRRGEKDINPILSVSESSFMVRETNGHQTSFQRVQ